MRTNPHHVDPQQRQATGRPERDAEPMIPGPLPQADRRGSRTALAVMLVAIAIIVLVVVL
jgi:hypothetical protein